MKMKTCEILPLTYGIAVRHDSYKDFYPPVPLARAWALLKTRRESEREFTDFRNRVMDGAYELEFPIEEYLRDEKFLINLRKGIKDKLGKRGSYSLWDVGGEEAVIEYREYGNSISGRVKSITDGRKTGGAYRKTRIIAPQKLGFGDVEELYSESDYFFWTGLKEPGRTKRAPEGEVRSNVHIFDIYLATLQLKYAHENGEYKPLDVLPYYISEYPDLAKEVIVAYYLTDMDLYDINKNLFSMEEMEDKINPGLLRKLERGDAVIEVIRQRGYRVREADPQIQGATVYVKTRFERFIESKGFRKSGITVELKDSEQETCCENWEKETYRGREFIRLLFHPDFPLLWIHRILDRRSPMVFFEKEEYTEHPLRMLGVEQERVDDRTRRKTFFKIKRPDDGIPIRIPNVLRPLYELN